MKLYVGTCDATKTACEIFDIVVTLSRDEAIDAVERDMARTSAYDKRNRTYAVSTYEIPEGFSSAKEAYNTLLDEDADCIKNPVEYDEISD